ncbi:hypothetical protein [Candidatus Colwellia aromaticivorans]|uniref:hypothetical protein n=1 Tax=Candidatus Colwellia aromaticivorans TaxID=2267621 RepID=UPI000DF38439|nr:hypothetical protein [Candidatus Colwellia aromaticivorans]
MQFLKSLFCLQGFDNRTRFFGICSAVYVIFIMLISAFTGKAFISLTILAFFTLILALASLRRLKDAKLNRNWLFVPNLLFILTALTIIFSEQNSSYYLLIIPAFCFAVLLTYPSVGMKNSSPKNYILGYFGPVDMTEYQQIAHQGKKAKFRIEPTLVGDNSVNLNSQSLSSDEQVVWQSHETTSPYNKSEQQIDLGEVIRLKLIKNRKAQLVIAIILTTTLVSVCTSWLMDYLSDNEPVQTIQESVKSIETTQDVIERKHPLAMPDNFSLLLSQHQGIIINWQADEVTSPLLWSQSSAQGDESCQQISFNKGNPIRTLMVQVENSTTVTSGVYNNYFASFSPLDSKALIQALAFRGSFSLCGYNFSLKGSQAALGQNKHYADWVEY